jgi:ATP-dependent helicase/DNAse subunit B
MNIKKQLESRDPYKAVWVSHSSMGDFLKCPRLYYLHNVYKNKSGRKIAIISPHMSLGVAVHNTLENLVNYNSEERIKIISNRLLLDFENNWAKVSGKIGGFVSSDQETEFKSRGIEMIQRVALNPGPLIKKTVHFPPKINNAEKVDMLPHYFLNDTDNIILCGKVDWLEYLPETDSLNVIDFKTGKHEEKEGSLQLPIYQLLLSKLQRRNSESNN